MISSADSSSESRAGLLRLAQTASGQGRPDEALSLIDRAIGMEAADTPQGAQETAVLWMNKGNMLQQAGRHQDAADAYRQTITTLEPYLGQEGAPPALAATTGAAWLNRGVALQQLQPADNQLILEAFEKSVAGLRKIPPQAHPAHARNLGAALMHLAQTRLTIEGGQAVSAVDPFVRESLALLAPSQASDPGAALVSLQGRLLFCRMHGANPAAYSDLTDLIDDGLTLARNWAERGLSPAGELAFSLIHVGTHLFATRQPHFVAEFLNDHRAGKLTPNLWPSDPHMKPLAVPALQHAWHQLQNRKLATAGSPDENLDAATSELQAAITFWESVPDPEKPATA